MGKTFNVVDALEWRLWRADAQETRSLQQSVNPIHWFLLLARRPEFAPESEWWFDLRDRCDLPWSQLLAAQPQFERHCQWESVSRLELILLAYRAPEIFHRRFPLGRVHDLDAFLTSLEKARLLAQLPEYAERVDWEALDRELSIGEWFFILTDQPQFEENFDWSRVEKQPSAYWDMLLKKQPQFACHCDLDKLSPCQKRKLQKHQPQLFGK